MDRAQRLIPHVFMAAFFVFLWIFPFSSISADQYSGCYVRGNLDALCPDEGTAAVEATKDVNDFLKSFSTYTFAGCTTGSFNFSNVRVTCETKNSLGQLDSLGRRSRMFPKDQPCSSRPADSWSSRSPDISNMDGAVSCRNGCTALNKVMSLEGDTSGVTTFSAEFLNATCNTFPQNCAQYGSGWYFSSVFLACMPPQQPCPDGQSKGTNGKCKEACPAGMVEQANGTCKPKSNECPAGQIKGPDGSCIDNGQCPVGQTKGPDGTCKPEKPPEEDGPDNCPAGQKADANGKCQFDESFQGGDDCSAPPTCSGSPILCGQARIQWRIDCNTRRNTNVSGGTCASVPVCTGDKCDAVEYAQLIQQWKTACALEKLAAGGSTDPGDSNGQPDWTKVTGMSQDPGTGASGDDTKVLTDKTLSPNDLDQGGFGGGSCMGFVSGSAGGELANGFAADLLNPPAFWCNYVAAIKAVMILLGAVAAAYILSRPT